ncbi:hypothetical protein Sjap_011342 [Stephania japonica]|uniref:Uncharacterized protein n=1 Tax=Stephania japonica TaxID=461633 RepID=A0AAP0P7B8_9MAGN
MLFLEESTKVALQFPVGCYSQTVGSGALAYLFAVLEYLTVKGLDHTAARAARSEERRGVTIGNGGEGRDRFDVVGVLQGRNDLGLPQIHGNRTSSPRRIRH